MAKKLARTKKSSAKTETYLDKIETKAETNQSKVSMVLGALIVLVIGILVFNYFNRNQTDLGPAQQTQTETQQEGQDVAKDKLPGKYTVKEGDTLFIVAEKYYDDGFKFTEIVKANNLSSPDQIEVGQVLEIPKVETQIAQASAEPSAEPTTEPTTAASPAASEEPASPKGQEDNLGTGTGGGNTTIWGPRIEGNKYTVVEGDWLSTIAGRAYGDIMSFEKIAKANNIQNPDLIEPGTVLTIPR